MTGNDDGDGVLPVRGTHGAKRVRPPDATRERYASYGDEVDITALYRSVDCRPCINLQCENPICMTTITPETVLETASKSIQSLMDLRNVKDRGQGTGDRG